MPTDRPSSRAPTTSGLTNTTKQWDTKNQHRIWWNASKSRWDAILPASTTVGANASAWMIAKQAHPQLLWSRTRPMARQLATFNSKDRPDVYWDQGAGKLYVLMSGATTQSYVYNYAPAGHLHAWHRSRSP